MNPVTVYQARRLSTGDSYIGITARGLKKRSWEHKHAARKGSLTHFHSALRKYGPEAFTFEVRASLPSFKEACIAERILIALETPRYNITTGGEGVLGLKRPDTSARLAARKGIPLSAEHRVHLKEARNLRVMPPMSEESKRKVSLANTGKVRSAEARAKMSKAKIGNKNAQGSVRSLETRAKISAAQRARFALKVTEQQQANLAVGKKG